MSKKKKIILITSLVILVLGGVIFFILQNQNGRLLTSESPLTNLANTEVIEVMADATYEDAAGFSFQYPSQVEVEDITPEDDNTYYSLVSAKRKGDELLVSAKDTTAKSIDAWLESDDAPKNLSLTGATTLDKLSANQYSSSDKLFTVVIDKSVLYLIESPSDKFWEDTHNLVVETFAFAGTETSSGAAAPATNVIYEAEEVIE